MTIFVVMNKRRALHAFYTEQDAELYAAAMRRHMPRTHIWIESVELNHGQVI